MAYKINEEKQRLWADEFIFIDLPRQGKAEAGLMSAKDLVESAYRNNPTGISPENCGLPPVPGLPDWDNEGFDAASEREQDEMCAAREAAEDAQEAAWEASDAAIHDALLADPELAASLICGDFRSYSLIPVSEIDENDLIGAQAFIDVAVLYGILERIDCEECCEPIEDCEAIRLKWDGRTDLDVCGDRVFIVRGGERIPNEPVTDEQHVFVVLHGGKVAA